ncbi:MAG TPA: GcrA family cell cycle regulator [Rhizomicrobium sp.]|jgi:hypothetical protein|nr:GcrA family cell cycle regulator [Rhizomicrobium sp.]
MSSGHDWSLDEDIRLAELAAEGASGSGAALALHMTRNAVIARARRLGIAWKNKRGEHGAYKEKTSDGTAEKRPRKVVKADFRKPINGPSTPPRPVTIAPAAEEPDPLGSPGKHRDGCKWIHGEVDQPGWRQCGHKGEPWCPHHHARVYAGKPRVNDFIPAIGARAA